MWYYSIKSLNLIKAFPSLKLPSQKKNTSHTYTLTRTHTTVEQSQVVEYGFSENLCFLWPTSHLCHSKAYGDVWVAVLTLVSFCVMIVQKAVRNILEVWNNSTPSFAFFFLSRSAKEKCNCIESGLNKMSAGILRFKVPATIPPSICYLVLMRCLYVFFLYIYLQHNNAYTRHRGKLGPRRFTVLSLLCSDVTISRNQISSQSGLNKYIFTCL